MKIVGLGRGALSCCVAAAVLSSCVRSGGSIAMPQNGAGSAFSNHRAFYYTGKRQLFKVPAGVKWVVVDARGGGGANRYYRNGTRGGRGGRVYALLPVSQGDALYVFVAGRGSDTNGGFNGGGSGGAEGGCTSNCVGFGGGGASDVRINGYGLKDRILVASGGGGQGGCRGCLGGAGGGRAGGHGGSVYPCRFDGGGGYGGTQRRGGDGGCGASAGTSSAGASGQPGASGTPGMGGSGGDGGLNKYFGSGGAGGAGGAGGGYCGGGGGGGGAAPYDQTGAGGGGGGGSSYVERSATDTHLWRGWKDAGGNGLVVFSW